MGEKYRKPIRDRSSTADYPRSHPHPNSHHKNRSSSANKSLVTKMNENQTGSIPNVIAPHKDHSIIPEVVPETRDKESEIAKREVNLANDVRVKNSDVITSHVNHTVAEVEEKYGGPTSGMSYSDTKVNGVATGEDVKVQVHRPANDVSIYNEFTSTHVTEKTESDSLDPNHKTKRKTSITISEKDALGLLDDVIRVFDDFDDNFVDVGLNESKQPDLSDHDPSYESMADVKKTLNRDDVKLNGVHDSSNSTYNTTASTSQEKQIKSELVPPTQSEPVYAVPNKLGKKKPSSTKPVQQTTVEKSPVVPVKKFVVDDNHEIKFSPLRKTSPSASLSKSLNNTTWANEIPSPKRKPINDNNDNFSLKRGQLSGPVPIITDDDYVEPPPDYDLNTPLGSLGKSATDDSFTRDTWGSVTSSSTSGSYKMRKEFRPEVKKLIEHKKAQKDDKIDNDSRQYDGLVNRSFRMRETSVKENASESAAKDETASQSDIESDYTNIKNEADNFLQGYERLRASSNEATQESISKLKSNMTTSVSTQNQKEQIQTPKIENGLPNQADTSSALTETTQAVLNQPRASDDMQISNVSAATKNEVDENKKGKKEKTKTKSKQNLVQNGEHDLSDDENLIKLIETGYSPEDQTEFSAPEPQRRGYVPRALRMSFGQSWEGIRKDRREWKSKEMRQAANQASRKGGKNLSNRFDEQKVQLEMLF